MIKILAVSPCLTKSYDLFIDGNSLENFSYDT